jgi:hypothetical protein
VSGFAAWHHPPGEFCTHPERVWHQQDGTVDKGPWLPDGPLDSLPKGEGHWVCPGHTGLGLGSGPGA